MSLRRFGWMGTLCLLAACSSKPKSSETPSDLTQAAPISSAGLLTFFDGAEGGVAVARIDWTQPIGSENPGADCTIRQKSKGPPLSTYVCVVRKEGEAPVVLTVQESGSPARLTKVIVDAKGEKTLGRWVADLAAAGYSEVPKKKKGWRYFVSANGRSEAALVWVPAKLAVTAILTPKGPVAAKPAAKAEGTNEGAAKSP